VCWLLSLIKAGLILRIHDNSEKKMNKIIPFEYMDVEKLPDEYLSEIEDFLTESFRKECDRTNGNTPIHEAKEYAISQVSKKFNLTIERIRDIINEIQMRKIDKELGKE
jgi:hypothetical protein